MCVCVSLLCPSTRLRLRVTSLSQHPILLRPFLTCIHHCALPSPVLALVVFGISATPALETPGDKSIMSLFVGGVEPPEVTEEKLRDYFYQFGELRAINLLPRQKAAFVHFTTYVGLFHN